MNPIPQTMPPPPIANGFAELVTLVSVLALVVIFALMIWSMWGLMRERVRLLCPIRMRPVRVLFRLDAAGKRLDVERCSVFGRRPITCGKVCMHPAANARLALGR